MMLRNKFSSGRYGNLVGALDQGTSSTRFLVFTCNTAEIVTYHQVETKQIFPKEGWVEQDPYEILSSVYTCIDETVQKLKSFETDPVDIKAIGITNQRETTIVWDKHTGKPLYNAIIWLDTRTADIVETLNKKRGSHFVREKSGLPVLTYFSAVKLRWLLDNVPEVTKAIEEDRCLFGTVDSWLMWNLTGGSSGGVHLTDVTNASRTMLMNVNSLTWDPWLCKFFGVPASILPKIKSSSEIFGYVSFGVLSGVPISGCLGDQSAAMVGQMCFSMGQTKNTYGTGCFLLCNTGKVPVWSEHGLLTTVAYKLGPNKPTYYALEGSVAIAGAAIRWLRDNLEVIDSSSAVEPLANSVNGTHGVYFVPAFSGLYAPYWQPDARGIICGLTQFATKAHIARATLEAVCFQTKDVLEAMNKDFGTPLRKLQVDGGMTLNNSLMQIQSDILGIPVIRPSMPETTALGAAMAAGIAEGIEIWNSIPSDSSGVTIDTFLPSIPDVEREYKYSLWKKAVQRSMHWNHCGANAKYEPNYIQRALPGSLFFFSSFALLLLAERLKNGL